MPKVRTEQEVTTPNTTPEYLVELNRIVAKQELTKNDIIFLRARQSYLTKEQQKQFADVLEVEKKKKTKKKTK